MGRDRCKGAEENGYCVHRIFEGEESLPVSEHPNHTDEENRGYSTHDL